MTGRTPPPSRANHAAQTRGACRTIRLRRVGDRWLLRGRPADPGCDSGCDHDHSRGDIRLDPRRGRMRIRFDGSTWVVSVRPFAQQGGAQLWTLKRVECVEADRHALRVVVRPETGFYVWRPIARHPGSPGEDGGGNLIVRAHDGLASLRPSLRRSEHRLAALHILSNQAALVQIGNAGGGAGSARGTDGDDCLTLACFAPLLWRPS